MTVTDSVLAVAALLLGAVVGSFLNVVIFRLPDGTFFALGSRSVCANPDCRKPVPGYLNLPVLGWLLLRGRAKCCGYRLSARYPMVEALTALLFFLLWVRPPWGPAVTPSGSIDVDGLLSFLLFAFFAANLVANSFIDIDHRILPDVLTKSLMVVGVVGAFLVPGLAGRFLIVDLSPVADGVLYGLAGMATGLAVTQGVRLLAKGVFGKEAMGFGDVKLMGGIGAFVGWQGVLLTFFVGCVLGAMVGVVHRWLTKDAYICFGPFLASGALITLFFGDDLVSGMTALQTWQQTSDAAPWVTSIGAVVCALLLVVLVRRGRAS